MGLGIGKETNQRTPPKRGKGHPTMGLNLGLESPVCSPAHYPSSPKKELELDLAKGSRRVKGKPKGQKGHS